MNGHVVQKGKEKGIPTPVNSALTAMIREIESGARAIRPANLEEALAPNRKSD